MEDVSRASEASGGGSRRIPLRTRRRVLAVIALLIVGITLGPTPVGMLDAAHDTGRWLADVLPGTWGDHPTRGETEGLLNVAVAAALVLVVAAAWPAIRPIRLLAGAIVISVVIESVQVAVPGRHPHGRDVVLNAIGAGLGVAAVVLIRRAWAGAATSSRT